jgi:hypothetical protein
MLAVFVVPAFRRVIADIQSQSCKPEALIAQEPFDVGRTWASLLWPLSKINRQNADTYRIASRNFVRKEVYTPVWNVSLLAYCTMNCSKEGQLTRTGAAFRKLLRSKAAKIKSGERLSLIRTGCADQRPSG